MRNSLVSIFRELSAILAGFKLAIILIGYFGFGSLARWVIEQWYPFTRWLWDNVFSYLYLPEITDVEKDALTAIVFFLPLGITAAIARILGNREENQPRMRVISASLGVVFVYAICGNIISFILTNAKLDERFVSSIVKAFSEGFDILLVATLVNAILSIFLVVFWRRIRAKLPGSKYLRILDKMMSWILSVLSNPSKVFAAMNRTILLIIAMLYAAIALFGATDLDSYLPLVAILFVFLSVLLSIFYTPTKLMVAAGASLAFISTAYAYELLVVAKRFIENAVP